MANADRTRSRRRRRDKDGLQDVAEEADDESGRLRSKRSRDDKSRRARQRFSGMPRKEEADDESGPLHGAKRSRGDQSRRAWHILSGTTQEDNDVLTKLLIEKFEALPGPPLPDPLLPAETDDSRGPPRKKSRTSPEAMDYSTSGFVPREDSEVKEARESMDSMDLE